MLDGLMQHVTLFELLMQTLCVRFTKSQRTSGRRVLTLSSHVTERPGFFYTIGLGTLFSAL
jgi:hypothetical protein